MSDSPSNPARWERDPTGRHEHRYWDGAQWTGQVADGGVLSVDPLHGAEAVAADSPTEVAPVVPAAGSPVGGGNWYARMPLWARIALPICAVLVFLVALGAIVGGGEKDDAVASNPADASGTVVTTSRLPPTTTRPTTATTVPPTTAPPTTTPPSTVPPTSPPTSPPQTAATLAPPPPPDNCNPNYSGCVPNASDVDCAGGSGNGPAYVSGPIQVIGTDVYDLDADNDGIACE